LNEKVRTRGVRHPSEDFKTPLEGVGAKEAFQRYWNPDTPNGLELGRAYADFGAALGYTRTQDDEIAATISSDESFEKYFDRDTQRWYSVHKD